MNQLNSIIIEGNVTRDAESKETANGHKVCNIPVAVNRFYKNSNGEGVNEVSYFNVETFGKMAEVCEEKCKKGHGIRVVGRLKQSRWQTAEGKTSSRVSIIAEHVEFKKWVSSEKAESDSTKEKENLTAMRDATAAACNQVSEFENKIEVQEEELVF
ncbi:MAG: single-stranded DNA-binding protein [Treponema sp.]|nr:single-stranded DNA-binding protein [Treponema sp.]